MIVTDKEYMIEEQLLKKLDLMIKRIKGTDDALLVIDGDEGQGKTECAFGVCYYVAYELKRKYDPSRIFFDLDEMIKFASSTKDQIIHFDEAALGLLRTQWQSKEQQKFLQLVMVARKKRHFIVVCIPKFHRLPPYAIEDRSVGLIHVYSHKNIHKGRYCYYTKEAKAKLYEDYNKRKIKSYKKHYSFRGKFVEASKKIFTQKQVDEYERKKDAAILSVGQEKNKMTETAKKWQDQRNKLIIGIKKDLKATAKQMEALLKKYGVEMKKTQIKEICPTRKIEVKSPIASALL